MSELAGKIITGVLTAVITLVVCLINNYYQTKRDQATREDAHKKQLLEMQETYSSQIGEVKNDYTSQVTDLKSSIKELHTVVDNLATSTNHSFEMLKLELSLLQQKQDKYNHLQERTFQLEKQTEIQEEKIKVANNRISDLEGKKD